jgi:hypothetical protein
MLLQCFRSVAFKEVADSLKYKEARKQQGTNWGFDFIAVFGGGFIV